MCSISFARSLGLALIPLAICCIVANVLLFFPDGVVDFVREGHLSKYVWFFMGIGGGGIAVSIIDFEVMKWMYDELTLILCFYFLEIT